MQNRSRDGGGEWALAHSSGPVLRYKRIKRLKVGLEKTTALSNGATAWLCSVRTRQRRWVEGERGKAVGL